MLPPMYKALPHLSEVGGSAEERPHRKFRLRHGCLSEEESLAARSGCLSISDISTRPCSHMSCHM